VDVFLNPLSSTTERYQRLKLNPKYGNRHKNQLGSKGYVQPRKIIHNKGRLTLFDITRKGKMALRDLGHDAKDFSEGIVHRFWKHEISEFYKRKGFEVSVEESINGRPDVIVKGHGKTVAIEVETGKSNALENLRRDLEAGFDQVVCVATDKKEERKIDRKVKEVGLVSPKVKITSAIRLDVMA
jgi:hypothetical protein